MTLRVKGILPPWDLGRHRPVREEGDTGTRRSWKLIVTAKHKPLSLSIISVLSILSTTCFGS
jgi:hypothetical protein